MAAIRLGALVVVLVLMSAARTYVLETGVYEKIVLDNGEVWLGVYPAGDHAEVRACRLRVRRVPSPDDDGSRAMKVEATPDREPLFLVKGARGVKAGNVRSLYTHREGDELPGRIALTLQGKKYVLDSRGSRVTLKADGKEMLLGECGPRDVVYPVWAGDLDGDGRLDVYVRTEHHQEWVGETLYLSSADATGKALTACAARLNVRKLE